jgi:hypothetical protein
LDKPLLFVVVANARRSSLDAPLFVPVLRVLVLGYGLVVCVATAWDWWTDITMLHRGEHLLPDIVLLYVGRPTSLLLDAVMPIDGPALLWPASLTICAAAQFGFLWWVVRKRGRGSTCA